RVFRDATLKLARDCEFARKLVNSGRLSVPAVLADSPLNTPDRNGDAFACAMRPGAAAADAPVRAQGASGWLLQHLGDSFAGVLFGLPADAPAL
ncbi:FAD-dependent oxidoreductase, partial [Paraburkholderia sp. SIMBA_027]